MSTDDEVIAGLMKALHEVTERLTQAETKVREAQATLAERDRDRRALSEELIAARSEIELLRHKSKLRDVSASSADPSSEDEAGFQQFIV